MNVRIALALALLATACSDEAIILATIAPADGGARPPPVSCITKADCAPGSYCERHDCGAAGICLPPPAICPDDEHEVCGESGVTYFNDCLRRSAGEGCATEGECLSGVECGGPSNIACADYATCLRLGGVGPDACGDEVKGTCWVIPATCPTPTMSDRWDDCSGTATCVDTCVAAHNAAQDGHAYRRAVHCD